MKKIKLTKGRVAIVDDSYFKVISATKWQLHSKGYATAQGKLLMHRIVMNAKKGQEVDHINLNKLDNRKKNLRFVTHQQNCMNRKIYRSNILKLKGVMMEKRTGKFYAQICVDKKRIHLGTFDCRFEASSAYKKAAKKYFKKFNSEGGVSI